MMGQKSEWPSSHRKRLRYEIFYKHSLSGHFFLDLLSNHRDLCFPCQGFLPASISRGSCRKSIDIWFKTIRTIYLHLPDQEFQDSWESWVGFNLPLNAWKFFWRLAGGVPRSIFSFWKGHFDQKCGSSWSPKRLLLVDSGPFEPVGFKYTTRIV